MVDNFYASKDELNLQKLHGSKEVQGVMCANSIFAECLILYMKSSLTYQLCLILREKVSAIRNAMYKFSG